MLPTQESRRRRHKPKSRQFLTSGFPLLRVEFVVSALDLLTGCRENARSNLLPVSKFALCRFGNFHGGVSAPGAIRGDFRSPRWLLQGAGRSISDPRSGLAMPRKQPCLGPPQRIEWPPAVAECGQNSGDKNGFFCRDHLKPPKYRLPDVSRRPSSPAGILERYAIPAEVSSLQKYLPIERTSAA